MVGASHPLVDSAILGPQPEGELMAIFIDKVTTAFELPGHRVVENCGVVRGIIVRSRSIVGSIGAGLQSLFGGNISLYTQLCERARDDAYELMLAHAREVGGNAVIGVRYDATEVGAGITEVLAYGTAVRVEPLS
jgi:uncharacterized protein YbjQ (UPF0145 family)